MNPDFNKATIDAVAKRAGFKCSNPDCRVNTVGPNSESDKFTVIGEAAHIFGARPNAKRYLPDMTDVARAEITNAIWLCRNCHKLIDTDGQMYSSNILFAWREQHEKYIISELGNATDKIRLEEQHSELSAFAGYPPLIRRIMIDRPPGWGWRLTAELMRYLNNPILRKIRDLRDGLYIKPQQYIWGDDFESWMQMRLAEVARLFAPLSGLAARLNYCWDMEDGLEKAKEIHHITCLIRDYLEQVVLHEEQVYFTNAPSEYAAVIDLFKNLIGSQAEKISEVPVLLDEVVSMLDEDQEGTESDDPIVIQKKITVDVPDGWTDQMNKELKKLGMRV